MGTRGTLGVISNNEEKLAYNNFDSYPDGLGADLLDFVIQLNKEDGWKKFKENIDKLIDVGSDKIKDDSIIKRYEKYANLDVDDKDIHNPYVLFRDIQGCDWLREVYSGNLEHYSLDNKFIYDSLYCEYGYVINLDTMKLEFYDGYQKKPQVGNRFGKELIDQYYPCRLIGVFNLKDINDSQYIVERMQYILESEKDDPSVNKYFRKPKLDKLKENI